MRRLLLLACTSTLSLSQSYAWAQQAQSDPRPAPFKILATDIRATATTEIIYDDRNSAGSSELATAPGEAVIFRDEATAASASIINNGGQTRFEDHATAAISQLVANESGRVEFSGNATADDADLVINSGGELSFTDDADAGTSQIANNGSTRFAGRSNAALAAITVNESGVLDFAEAAGAGKAQITNNGQTIFGGTSSLEGALLTNNRTGELVFRDDARGGTTSLIQNNGKVTFADRASLGGGNLIINEGAEARFEDDSDAGNNLVTTSGHLVFAGQSNASDVAIVGNNGATITFTDDASAANADITSAADVRFAGRAIAAYADITMAKGATVSFSKAADGGAARLHLDAGATFDIAPADGQIGIGSLGGAGDVHLGTNTLAVGNEAERVVFAGTISDNGGQGSIVKRGSGIWNLAGQSAYTGTTRIESGTIEAGRENALAAASAFTIDEGASLALAGFDQEIGSLAGAGSVDLATASLTAGADGRSTVFSGMIEGTGSLIKTGDGELALTGIGTYSGATRVNAGMLRVDGDIRASTVTVGTAGTLLGDGRVGATAVDGTLIGRANGGSLTVAGDLAMGGDATTIIELAGDRSGRFDVEGTAFLGGVLLLDPVAGISAGNQYVLFQADTIEGAFVFVEPSLAFLDADLVYGPEVLSLALERNGVEFQSVGETSNQHATALAIEQLGEGNVVYDAVLPLTAQAARAGFDHLSGEGHANALAALPMADALARQTVLGRLRNSSAPAGAWLTLQSSTSRLDDDGNGAGVKSDSHAVVGGIDILPLPDLRLGVAGHYTDTDLSNAARATQGDVTSAGVVAYGAWAPGPWRVRAGASLSAHDIELGRTIDVGSLQGRASSQYSGWSAGIFGEAGYAFEYNQVAIEPYAGISYLYARTNGFSESGAGDANLSSGGNRVSRSDAEIGIRAFRTYVLKNGIAIRPSVAVAYSHNLNGDIASSHHSYAGSAPFRVSSARSSRDAASVEARLDAQIANDLEAGLFYFGSFSGQGDAHTVGVSVRMKF